MNSTPVFGQMEANATRSMPWSMQHLETGHHPQDLSVLDGFVDGDAAEKGEFPIEGRWLAWVV